MLVPSPVVEFALAIQIREQHRVGFHRTRPQPPRRRLDPVHDHIVDALAGLEPHAVLARPAHAHVQCGVRGVAPDPAREDLRVQRVHRIGALERVMAHSGRPGPIGLLAWGVECVYPIQVNAVLGVCLDVLGDLETVPVLGKGADGFAHVGVAAGCQVLVADVDEPAVGVLEVEPGAQGSGVRRDHAVVLYHGGR